jgi:predicted RNA-binding protein with PUA-like domain
MTKFVDPETGNGMTLGRYYVLSDSGSQYMNPATREGAEGFATEAEAFAWCESQRNDPAQPYHDPEATYSRVNWPVIDGNKDTTMRVWLADDLQRMWLDTDPDYYHECN